MGQHSPGQQIRSMHSLPLTLQLLMQMEAQPASSKYRHLQCTPRQREGGRYMEQHGRTNAGQQGKMQAEPGRHSAASGRETLLSSGSSTAPTHRVTSTPWPAATRPPSISTSFTSHSPISHWQVSQVAQALSCGRGEGERAKRLRFNWSGRGGAHASGQQRPGKQSWSVRQAGQPGQAETMQGRQTMQGRLAPTHPAGDLWQGLGEHDCKGAGQPGGEEGAQDANGGQLGAAGGGVHRVQAPRQLNDGWVPVWDGRQLARKVGWHGGEWAYCLAQKTEQRRGGKPSRHPQPAGGQSGNRLTPPAASRCQWPGPCVCGTGCTPGG